MTSKLYIFDLDGTLTQPFANELDADIAAWLQRERPQRVAIATNQGGVGLRHWMIQGNFGDPAQYPEELEVYYRVMDIAQDIRDLTGGQVNSYVSFRYRSKAGNWSPIPDGRASFHEWSDQWRKPNPGMLLQALEDFGAAADTAVFVGDDWESDAGAAQAAGIEFVDVVAFRQHTCVSQRP
jgi:phosphoglycolate phosphatase-like HAD superfamily hydrolase